MTNLPISRARLDNKRRFVLYASDLIEFVNASHNDTYCRKLSVKTLNDLLLSSKLREGKDWIYNANRGDTALSIAAAQAILAIYASQHNNDKNTWAVFNQITDFIQGVKA